MTETWFDQGMINLMMIRSSLVAAYAVEYRALAVLGVVGSSELVSTYLSYAKVDLLVTILLLLDKGPRGLSLISSQMLNSGNRQR